MSALAEPSNSAISTPTTPPGATGEDARLHDIAVEMKVHRATGHDVNKPLPDARTDRHVSDPPTLQASSERRRAPGDDRDRNMPCGEHGIDPLAHLLEVGRARSSSTSHSHGEASAGSPTTCIGMPRRRAIASPAGEAAGIAWWLWSPDVEPDHGRIPLW